MLSYVYNHCLNFPESNTTYDPPPFTFWQKILFIVYKLDNQKSQG